MANLKLVADAMFRDRNLWSEISDEEKEGSFFIFNRYFSKKYPEHSQLLNHKLIDKVVAMDTWFLFMKGKGYPSWFWSKETPSKVKTKFSESDIQLLITKLKLKKGDIEYLIENFGELIEEEIKYYKKIEKQ